MGGDERPTTLRDDNDVYDVYDDDDDVGIWAAVRGRLLAQILKIHKVNLRSSGEPDGRGCLDV